MTYAGGGAPLEPREVERQPLAEREVRVAVRACGVCRTDVHLVDGELPRPKLPVVPGHQAVGDVVEVGAGVRELKVDDRVGVPWLAWACGACAQCAAGRENLCDLARFTGYTVDGGFAEELVAHSAFCVPMPASYAPSRAAPLLCAGAIGFRALRMSGDARRVGLYGFGSAGHILAQVAGRRGQEVFAFTRPGDREGQELARQLGVAWAGDSSEAPPRPLDAAIIFAPVGGLVPKALAAVGKGGVVVCAGIHMSDIPSFPYDLLWEERVLRSVANLTRADAHAIMALAAASPLEVVTTSFPLRGAQRALDALRAGEITGSAVLDIHG